MNLLDRYDLAPVHPHDRLDSDDAVRLFREGRSGATAERIDDAYSEDRYHNAVEAVLDAYPDIVRGGTDWDDALDTVYDRDISDPVGALIRRAGPHWFALTLDFDPVSLSDPDEVDRLVTALGVDDTAAGTVREFAAQATNYPAATVVLLVGMDYAAALTARHDSIGGTLTADGAVLAAFDQFAGTGFDTVIDAPITVNFHPDMFDIDAGHGSWTDWVCGGFPRYDHNVRIVDREQPSGQSRHVLTPDEYAAITAAIDAATDLGDVVVAAIITTFRAIIGVPTVQQEVDPSHYAIPYAQWTGIAEHLIAKARAVYGSSEGAILAAMEWVNRGPSSYHPDR